MRSKTKVRFFSAMVVGYMLIALSWWAFLLHRKTNVIYDLKQEVSTEFPEAEREYRRQNYMIASEAFVFAGALILGVVLLNRAFKREMVAVKQQKNFLLSVTHELKSPITAIRLILDTFKRRNLDTEKRDLLIQNGQQEAERLNKLVEDLLTAARLSPKTTLRRQSVDVAQLIRNLRDRYQRNYPELTFHKEKEDSNYSVSTNEPSLYLIVSNLLDNAVKYSNGQPEIGLNLKKKGQNVSLTVTDNGRGIPEEEKKKIFDQFYRIGDENIRSTQGTGLGLYLVNELCNKLDIKISVRDNQPTGSIFELAIPTKKKK